MRYGPNHKGMDWPNHSDLKKRFSAHLKILENHDDVTLLDLGCGAGLLVDYLQEFYSKKSLLYHGIDISELMIDEAKKKHPHNKFEVLDILNDDDNIPSSDFVIANGLFTEKLTLSFKEMNDFMEAMLIKMFQSCTIGISFNLMSSHVDWERSDLFHVSIDQVVQFLTKNVSRKLNIFMDYGLYEYTIHVYKS